MHQGSFPPPPPMGLGVVGQTHEVLPARIGRPRSEAGLFFGYRGLKPKRICSCSLHRDEPTHTLAEWEEIERRQRAFAADPAKVDAETADIERAMRIAEEVA